MGSLRDSYRQVAKPTPKPFFRRLTLDGLDSGDNNMADDFSSSPTIFYITPPNNEDWVLATYHITVTDNGSSARTDFGSISGLNNGLKFFTEVNNVRTFFSDTKPIKTNGDLAARGRAYETIKFTGENSTQFKDNLFDFSLGITLFGYRGDKFGVLLEDDLFSLSQLDVEVKGSNLGSRNFPTA